jgi:hypothetical protein
MNKTKQELLQSLLIDCMLADLDDPDKCTPGLYQVVRGVLNDNSESDDVIPQATVDFLANKLSDAIPFKKEAS